VRRGGSVEGLNVDEDIGVRLIVVTEYYIGGVRDGVVLHPLVHGSLASVAATFSRNTRGAKYCVKEGDKGLNSGIVRSGMKPQSMGAVHKVAVAWSHKGVSERFGDSAAGGAASYVALPLRGRQEEEINGEGNREVLGDLEGEEGGAKGVVRGDGDAPEPRGGAFGSIAVKKAGSARGRGIRSVKEGKEGERRHHCRSCSLSVWVASGVEAIQIIDEGGRIVGVV